MIHLAYRLAGAVRHTVRMQWLRWCASRLVQFVPVPIIQEQLGAIANFFRGSDEGAWMGHTSSLSVLQSTVDSPSVVVWLMRARMPRWVAASSDLAVVPTYLSTHSKHAGVVRVPGEHIAPKCEQRACAFLVKEGMHPKAGQAGRRFFQGHDPNGGRRARGQGPWTRRGGTVFFSSSNIQIVLLNNNYYRNE